MWTRYVIVTGKVCRLRLWRISKTKISGLVVSENSNSHCSRQLKKLSLSVATEWKSDVVYSSSENPNERRLHALRAASKLGKFCKPHPSGEMVWFYPKIHHLWHTFCILDTEQKESLMKTTVTLMSGSHQLQKPGPPQILYWFR